MAVRCQKHEYHRRALLGRMTCSMVGQSRAHGNEHIVRKYRVEVWISAVTSTQLSDLGFIEHRDEAALV